MPQHSCVGPFRRGRVFGLARGLVFAVAATLPLHSSAAESLRDRIDRAIESAHSGPLAPLANDGEFVRRASLDLIGRVPDPRTVRAFLADASPSKRQDLVNRLLASPEHARHLATVFDVVLTERRPGEHVKSTDWSEYLHAFFAARRPLNELFREILVADGTGAGGIPPAAARFLLDRQVEPHLLTRDVGRLYFGLDLGCAQCHDHPLIRDYHQADYFGLHTLLSRSFLFTDKEKKVSVAEKGEGDLVFQSVFDPSVKHTAHPRIPGGNEIVEPRIEKGAEYIVAPADGVRPQPTYSRRARLAAEVTGGKSTAFHRNLANRLWTLLMGQGLVHPTDLDHRQNPPTHARLLADLGRELAASNFDSASVLREVALSRAYQRSSDAPQGAPGGPSSEALRDELARREALYRDLSAEAEARRTAAEPLAARHLSARRRADTATLELSRRDGSIAKAREAVDAAAAAVAKAENDVTARGEASGALARAVSATEEALEKLGTDAAVTDAAAKLRERAQGLAGETTALREAVAKHSEAGRLASDTLAVARAEHEIVAWENEAAREELREVEASAVSLETCADEAAASADEAFRALEACRENAACEEILAQAGTSPADEEAALDARARRARRRFAVASIRPLTPEQLSWSALAAAGEIQRTAEEVLREAKPDEVLSALEIERRVHAKLKDRAAAIVSVNAGAPGQAEQEFQPTAEQALFFLNAGEVQGLLNPAGGNLASRILKLPDAGAVAEELYLSVLSRLPAPEEAAAVAAHFAAYGQDRAKAVPGLIWALLSSTEFRFQH